MSDPIDDRSVSKICFKFSVPLRFSISGNEFEPLFRKNGLISKLRRLNVRLHLISTVGDNIYPHFLCFQLSGPDVGRAIRIIGPHLQSFQASIPTDIHRVSNNATNAWTRLSVGDKWLVVKSEFVALFLDASSTIQSMHTVQDLRLPYNLKSIVAFLGFVRNHCGSSVVLSSRSSKSSKMKKLFENYFRDIEHFLNVPSDSGNDSVDVLSQLMGVTQSLVFVLEDVFNQNEDTSQRGMVCHCKTQIRTTSNVFGLAISQKLIKTNISKKVPQVIGNADFIDTFVANRHFHICAFCGVVEGRRRFKVCQLCKDNKVAVQYYFCSFPCQLKSWRFHKWYHRILCGRFIEKK